MQLEEIYGELNRMLNPAATYATSSSSKMSLIQFFELITQLEEVYGEVYRVLKPGTYFVSYEWVATDKFDASNKEHVRIMDEINFGNGLPVS